MKALLAFGVFLIVGIFLIKYERDRGKRKAKLKHIYEDLLKGSDKAAALKAGREYYASIRIGGRLTIYDEQAIANDLSIMKG